MANCTVNGQVVLSGTISLPRIGVWTADVELPAPDDGSTQLSGPAALTLGVSQRFAGTFTRSGLDRDGRMRARIVGGAAGMGKTLAPKSYLGTSLRIALSDVLTEAGEKLSPSSDQPLLGSLMPAWSRMRGVAGGSFAALVDSVSASWRVLPDGSVWVGSESWPAASMDFVSISADLDLRHRTVASLNPTVLPGQTFDGDRIVYVQHLVSPRALRTVLQVQ